ncbi:CcoQ/FixQ family Cbb3-type cytochrome c oxidase assembly chaperone [Flavobacterium kingsejongi]|uniref:CcoQ/FixQ family Cbb3-type cytochrome c oxidase assembly chaperone n=1 Tax=Flavobacterium kingsejongi TaxID=1678728 RepID=A0A2S1LR35_9FLAO|nr:CcoQ/FixQ family Cbb3-type cytochrome c oxidase assembly chaperone [Flavobacterium kingsejongi]AWG26106.1 CcoQ/FixQ family Cbb3-type cytochrome c oxidase assembly chaperone [Flavobacterium kingsejongi]
MLKFINQHMATIAGIEIFPIISLLIFFTFFVGLGLWVFSYKKDTIRVLSEMPLEEDTTA